jgi:hypothetical protein
VKQYNLTEMNTGHENDIVNMVALISVLKKGNNTYSESTTWVVREGADAARNCVTAEVTEDELRTSAKSIQLLVQAAVDGSGHEDEGPGGHVDE